MIMPGRDSGRPPLRFALLGCGDVGAKDAAAVAAAPGADLVACFDPVTHLAEELAGRHHARAARGIDDVLEADDVDAVLVATPPDTHAPLVLAALDAGKHVLIEKPLAESIDAARRIATAAVGTPGTAAVLFPLRGDERFRKALAAVEAGALGTPIGAAATYLVGKPPSYYDGGFSGRSPSSWRRSRQRSGGGFLISNLIHHIDAVRALLGVDADHVFAHVSPSLDAPEVEAAVAVVARFGTATVTFNGAGNVPGGPEASLALWGTGGYVEVLPGRPEPPGVARGEPHALAVGEGQGRALGVRPRTRVVDRFAAAARHGRRPDVGIDDALAVQVLITAAYESATTGRPATPASPATSTGPAVKAGS